MADSASWLTQRIVSYTFFYIPHFYFPASGQAVVTGVVPSPSRFVPSIVYRAQGSAIPLLVDFSSSGANSRSRTFCTSICAQEGVPANYMHSRGLEPTKLTYTRLEDNLIRHRGDQYTMSRRLVIGWLGLAAFYAHRFSSTFAVSRSRAFRSSFFCARSSPYEQQVCTQNTRLWPGLRLLPKRAWDL